MAQLKKTITIRCASTKSFLSLPQSEIFKSKTKFATAVAASKIKISNLNHLAIASV